MPYVPDEKMGGPGLPSLPDAQPNLNAPQPTAQPGAPATAAGIQQASQQLMPQQPQADPSMDPSTPTQSRGNPFGPQMANRVPSLSQMGTAVGPPPQMPGQPLLSQAISQSKVGSVLKMFNMERSGAGQGSKKPKIMPKWYREGTDAFLDSSEMYYRRSKERNGRSNFKAAAVAALVARLGSLGNSGQAAYARSLKLAADMMPPQMGSAPPPAPVPQPPQVAPAPMLPGSTPSQAAAPPMPQAQPMPIAAPPEAPQPQGAAGLAPNSDPLLMQGQSPMDDLQMAPEHLQNPGEELASSNMMEDQSQETGFHDGEMKLAEFATSFVAACQARNLSPLQIKAAAVTASRIHPEIADELKPLLKLAFFPAIKMMAGAAGKGIMGAGRSLLGAGQSAYGAANNAAGKAMGYAGRAWDKVPGVIRNPVGGAMTGSALGYGVDAVGDMTGAYDTGGAGSSLGGLLGAGARSGLVGKLTRSVGNSFGAASPVSQQVAGLGRQTRRFFTGGGNVNPALEGTHFGTAQKALGTAGLAGFGWDNVVKPQAERVGRNSAMQALDAKAQQHGMTADQLLSLGGKVQNGDWGGLISHMWDQTDPQTKMMLMGGLGLGGLGLLGNATGYGGQAANLAGLGGLGLLGAGLYRGGGRAGLFAQ